jgi:hypothetical protein
VVTEICVVDGEGVGGGTCDVADWVVLGCTPWLP